MKDCYKCKQCKAFTEFNRDNSRKDKLDIWCRACRKTHYRKTYEHHKKTIYAWRKKNPDKDKGYRLKHEYDISIEIYHQMLSEQKHRCGICNRHRSEFSKDFCVDHNHLTGTIRGLLCADSNLGLDKFKDSEDILTKAIKYVQRIYT